MQLFLKGNMKAYWMKLCPILIDLVTNSKCTGVLKNKKLQILLYDQYIVRTGMKGCFLIDCSCLGKYTSSNDGNRFSDKQMFVFKGLLQIIFKSVLIQYHIPCLCYCPLITAQWENTKMIPLDLNLDRWSHILALSWTLECFVVVVMPFGSKQPQLLSTIFTMYRVESKCYFSDDLVP